MTRRVGSVLIESIAAESAKFTAPMLLVHGLWCTAAVWRRFEGYLAHRGWTCHALTLRGHAEAPSPVPIGRVRFADYVEDVHQAIAACEAPPVVVGHDLGGLLALHCAAAVRAIVALAPLVPCPLTSQPNRVLTRMRSRLAMWRARPLPPPSGKLGSEYFGATAPQGTTTESGTVARELTRGDLRFAVEPAVPILIVAGRADGVSPPQDVERLAQYARATFRAVDGAGHGLPWEAGWEQRVGEIHRWLLQELGEPLLIPCDEEE